MKEIEHLKKNDPILEELIATLPPPQYTSTHSVFHDLMGCIIEQQIHYRSSKKLFQKMLDKANMPLLSLDNFPEFERIAFEGTTLSGKKYETILNCIQHWEKLDVKWELLSDEEVVKELSQIKGVGKWTIDMILLFTLERPNIFAYDDYHIKQIMTRLYALNSASRLKAQMKEIAEPWSPYKSTAFLYLLDWKKWNSSNSKK